MKFGWRFLMHDQELSLLTLSAIWFILEYSHWVCEIPIDLTNKSLQRIAEGVQHMIIWISITPKRTSLLNKGVPSLLGVVLNYDDLFTSTPLVAKACLGSRMQ